MTEIVEIKTTKILLKSGIEAYAFDTLLDAIYAKWLCVGDSFAGYKPHDKDMITESEYYYNYRILPRHQILCIEDDGDYQVLYYNFNGGFAFFKNICSVPEEVRFAWSTNNRCIGLCYGIYKTDKELRADMQKRGKIEATPLVELERMKEKLEMHEIHIRGQQLKIIRVPMEESIAENAIGDTFIYVPRGEKFQYDFFMEHNFLPYSGPVDSNDEYDLYSCMLVGDTWTDALKDITEAQKKASKNKTREETKKKLKDLGKPVPELINELPIRTLLKIGRAVRSTDYAVRFYYKKEHPKFHLNKEALRKAIRREYGMGNNHEKIIDILAAAKGLEKENLYCEAELV